MSTLKVNLFNDKKEKDQSFECCPEDSDDEIIASLEIDTGYGANAAEAFAEFNKNLLAAHHRLSLMIEKIDARKFEITGNLTEAELIEFKNGAGL